MIIGGIFGPKLSGKTTLARHISIAYMKNHRVRSLILDPHCRNKNGELINTWGPHAWVTDDEQLFWHTVWQTSNCLIIVEEASSTIAQDKELTPVFTRLTGHFGEEGRHQHRLIIVGHRGTNLLPQMREQVDELWLFRQPFTAAEYWAESFADEQILQVTQLKQYEFLHVKMYKNPEKCKLKI